MLALLSEFEPLDSNCAAEGRHKQLKSMADLLETENFLIESFLARNLQNLVRQDSSGKDSFPSSEQSASLKRKIDLADKMRIALSEELEQLETRCNDKLRYLNAVKAELGISCEEVSALRDSIERKFQASDPKIKGKLPSGFEKFFDDWLEMCRQKREKAHLKATALKRMCSREEQDFAFKFQAMKHTSPAEYVRLRFDNKKYRMQLEDICTEISKLRRDHALILGRKITENRKSIELAKMRRKLLEEMKSMQASDLKLQTECEHMSETISLIERQIEEFRERVNATEIPRVSLSDYAKVKDKCEKLASVVKVVDRKMGLAKK